MHILSENVPFRFVEDMKARSSQKRRASTVRWIVSTSVSSRPASGVFTRPAARKSATTPAQVGDDDQFEHLGRRHLKVVARLDQHPGARIQVVGCHDMGSLLSSVELISIQDPARSLRIAVSMKWMPRAPS